MEEITLDYFEEHFDEIMNRLETDEEGFLVRTPTGEGIVLVPYKNEIIERMEKQGLIEEFK